MRHLLTYGFILLVGISFGQQNLIPIGSFYKDQVFANKLNKPYNEGSFFPVVEADYNLINAIVDSSKQYYEFTQTLFKKHLFEIEAKDCQINISPVIDFSLGRDLADTNDRKLFQNTRGVYMEVDLFKNFSFSTAFFENQGRYTRYESNFYESAGERYPQPDSTYQRQNAVIPGAARTKYFKDDGFDYAYAIGSFCYRPVEKILIAAGNNQQFIGEGHRSLLLSDNSAGIPYLRITYKMSEKFTFSYMRARALNLLRRPYTNTAEAYYETKGLAVNYLTYKPTENINISLFEGTLWNQGDSISSQSLHPLYYNPITLVSSFAVDEPGEINPLIGLNAGAQILPKHRVYGQVAFSNLEFSSTAFQIGYRGYNFFGLNDFMIQLEYNAVPENFYESENPRLNYSNYNLPLAHARSNSFNEFLVRINYEWNRVYFEQAYHYYDLKNHSGSALLPIYQNAGEETYSINYSNSEIGYRFNRKMNLCLFGAFTYRIDGSIDGTETQFVSIGLRTAILNHYKDF